MKSNDKNLRDPCYQVIDWLVRREDSGEFAQSAAQTMKEGGLYGTYQEQVLADACAACGMQDNCEYANKCEIGEIERQPAAIPRHRLPDNAGTDVGKGYVRNR